MNLKPLKSPMFAIHTSFAAKNTPTGLGVRGLWMTLPPKQQGVMLDLLVLINGHDELEPIKIGATDSRYFWPINFRPM